MLNRSVNVLGISDVPWEGAANRRQMTFAEVYSNEVYLLCYNT